jgi:hypothetical protein
MLLQQWSKCSFVPEPSLCFCTRDCHGLNHPDEMLVHADPYGGFDGDSVDWHNNIITR